MERMQVLESALKEKQKQFAAVDAEFNALISKQDVAHIGKWRKAKQAHYAELSGQIARLKADIIIERMWTGFMEDLGNGQIDNR